MNHPKFCYLSLHKLIIPTFCYTNDETNSSFEKKDGIADVFFPDKILTILNEIGQ